MPTARPAGCWTIPGKGCWGSGAKWERIARFVADAAKAPSPVLILGESGTGKEVVARSIQANSPRSAEHFVVVDCAALQGDLLESELFGHEKGAFTGAVTAKSGLVEVADGGTLFVDEIGEMPLELQAKLLRVLEHGEYRKVGGTHAQKADLRVLAATNRDLAAEVKAGRFRSDLFYRLNVLSITLPPLRERIEDIALLAQHFLENTRVTMAGNKRFHQGVINLLESYTWPGNVRELANVVERAIILSGSSQLITPDHLPPEIRRGVRRLATSRTTLRSLEQAEKEAIIAALEATSGNRTHAAKALGTSLVTLRRKISKYGIEL